MTTEGTPAAAPAAAPAALPDQNATAALAPETKPEGQQPPERTFSQKELDDIVEKRLAKERRKREELTRRLAVTEELALKGRSPEPRGEPKPQDGAEQEPKRTDFDDYETYMRALGRWEGRQAARDERKKEREETERTKTADEQRKLETTFRDHAGKAMKEIEDFEEVVSSSEAMVTMAMREAMLHAGDIGPRILYHLAKNPDEAQRIAALPVPRQAAEIGKLEVKLSGTQKDPKQSSKAPEPINPIGGRAPATDDEPDPNLNGGADWRKWRERTIRAKKKG